MCSYPGIVLMSMSMLLLMLWCGGLFIGWGPIRDGQFGPWHALHSMQQFIHSCQITV